MQHSFFDDQNLSLVDADISYTSSLFDPEKANLYFEELTNEVPWQHDEIILFGKRYMQPRLTALFGEKEYSYSNIKMTPYEFTPTLLEIKKIVEEKSNHLFNVCLLNLYRDGNDSNGWHSDDEKELGTEPVIASVSFGKARMFHLRHKQNKMMKHKILLEHNSLLLMKGRTQQFWQHQIPKSKKILKPRINLTFRYIA